MSQSLQDATPKTQIVFRQAESTVAAQVVGFSLDKTDSGLTACQLKLQLAANFLANGGTTTFLWRSSSKSVGRSNLDV